MGYDAKIEVTKEQYSDCVERIEECLDDVSWKSEIAKECLDDIIDILGLRKED